MELIDRLCIDCYMKIKELITVPTEIQGKYCKVCGSEWVSGKWIKSADQDPLTSIVYREIDRNIKTDPNVTDVEYTIVKQWLDYNDHPFIDVDIRGKIGNRDFRLTRTISLKVERVLCPSCLRRKSRYYEAIIQLRTKTGEFTQSKRTVFESFFNEEVINNLSDVIEGREGIDYYFINKGVAKRLVSSLMSTIKYIKITESFQDERMKNGKKSAKLVISVRI